MIYSFTPYSTEKNFGKAINEHCKLVPKDEDWICIRDGDMMNLTPNWGNIIQEAIDEYGKEYALFGCWTNRLSKLVEDSRKQLVSLCYDHPNINFHYNVAKIYSERGNDISPTQNIAGMFMLFQKKTWIECGGFPENDPNKPHSASFDHKFCAKVRAKGGKIGLINRLYVFHLYRIWAGDRPWLDTKHLKQTKI